MQWSTKSKLVNRRYSINWRTTLIKISCYLFIREQAMDQRQSVCGWHYTSDSQHFYADFRLVKPWAYMSNVFQLAIHRAIFFLNYSQLCRLQEVVSWSNGTKKSFPTCSSLSFYLASCSTPTVRRRLKMSFAVFEWPSSLGGIWTNVNVNKVLVYIHIGLHLARASFLPMITANSAS